MTDVAASSIKVQQEAIQFNQPVSEASLDSIAGLANYLREIIMPIGSVVASMLTESDFQAQTTNPTPERWVLADGRNVAGSAYEALTGNSTIPDLRAVFLRGKDNGRGLFTNLPLGDFQPDTVKLHHHSYSAYEFGGGPHANATLWGNGGTLFSEDTDNTGDTDGHPKMVTVNFFIRIN